MNSVVFLTFLLYLATKFVKATSGVSLRSSSYSFLTYSLVFFGGYFYFLLLLLLFESEFSLLWDFELFLLVDVDPEVVVLITLLMALEIVLIRLLLLPEEPSLYEELLLLLLLFLLILLSELLVSVLLL